MHEVQAMMHVERNRNLTVTSALKDIARGVFKLLAYAFVVVELAIDNSVDLVVWRVEWLRSVWGKVVNGKPYVAKGCVFLSAAKAQMIK